MQCSLFSCVTKANLDSDSALQPTTLDLNTNSLSHAGPAHMWEASYRLSILSTGLMGKRPWGQIPEQPLSSLSLRSTKTSFSRTFYFSQSWSNPVSLDVAFLDSSLLLALWHSLKLPEVVRLKNLKFSCSKTNNPNSNAIQSITILLFKCLLIPGIRSQGEKKAGKRILENSTASDRVLVGEVMVQRLPAGFVPISKLHIPWAPCQGQWVTQGNVVYVIILNTWHSAFWRKAFNCVCLTHQAWGPRATKKPNTNKSFQVSHDCGQREMMEMMAMMMMMIY